MRDDEVLVNAMAMKDVIFPSRELLCVDISFLMCQMKSPENIFQYRASISGLCKSKNPGSLCNLYHFVKCVIISII